MWVECVWKFTMSQFGQKIELGGLWNGENAKNITHASDFHYVALCLGISNDLKVDYTMFLFLRCLSFQGFQKWRKRAGNKIGTRKGGRNGRSQTDPGRKSWPRQLDMIEMYQLRIYCNWNSLTWEKFACNQKDMLELMWYTEQSIYMFSCFFHAVVSLAHRSTESNPPKKKWT